MKGKPEALNGTRIFVAKRLITERDWFTMNYRNCDWLTIALILFVEVAIDFFRLLVFVLKWCFIK